MCKGLLGLKFSGIVGSVLFACCKFDVSHVVQTINENSDSKLLGGLRLLGCWHKGSAVLERSAWVGSLPWERKGGKEVLSSRMTFGAGIGQCLCDSALVGCSVFISEAKNF